MAEPLDELLVALGFDYDSEEIDQFKKDIKGATKFLKQLATFAAAGAAAMTALVVVTTEATDEQGKFAQSIGETITMLDALQHANVLSGGSAQGLSNALGSLAVKAAEAARGVGAGVEIFGILGLQAQDANGEIKQSSDLLIEVATRMQGLSKQQQIDLAEKLGVSDALLLLQQGPDAIRAMVKEAEELGTATEEDARIAAEFQDNLTRLMRVVAQISRVLTRQFAPILMEIQNLFIDWWKANRQLIDQDLPIWIERLVFALKLLALATIFYMGLRFVQFILGFTRAVRVATLATLAWNAAVAALPIIIAGIAAAFILLANDAKTFFEGGDSFIGDMLEKYPEWADQIHMIAAAFASLSDGLSFIADLTSLVFEGWKGIADVISNLSLEGFKEFANSLPGFIGDLAGFGDGEDTSSEGFFSRLNPFGGESPSVPGTAPLGVSGNTQSTTNTTTRSISVDKIDIVVPTTGDPVAGARAVDRELQQTFEELDSTVAL